MKGRCKLSYFSKVHVRGERERERERENETLTHTGHSNKTELAAINNDKYDIMSSIIACICRVEMITHLQKE